MLRCLVVLCVLSASAVVRADWPHWRGPAGTGVSPDANLPLRWSATENVAWKARLAGLGVSTPIVVGDLVIATSQIGAGVRQGGNHPRLTQGGDAAAAGERPLGAGPAAGSPASDETLFLVEAFHRVDGRRLWEHRMAAEGPLTPVHDKHNLASPSPASNGSLVYAWFGTGQLVALDLSGAVVWQRHLGRELSPFDIQWGHASSPVVHGDLVILLCDHGPAANLLALDARTGRERWRAPRGSGRSSYSTPLVVPGPNGAEIIVNSDQRIDAYDAATGAPLWHAGESNRFPIPMPVFHDGVLYATRGYRSGPYMALRVGGRGDVSSTHQLWRVPTGAPYVASIVYANGLLFMANDTGVVTAVSAATGARVWQHRVGGIFSASPIVAGDRVYFVSETGETIVMRADRTPEMLARNDVGERLVASPAASDGRLFLRSDDQLIAIGR